MKKTDLEKRIAILEKRVAYLEWKMDTDFHIVIPWSMTTLG